MQVRSLALFFLLSLVLGVASPVRAQEGGKFRIPLKKARLPVGVLEGAVTDRTGAPLPATLTVRDTTGADPASKEVAVDPASGTFEVRLTPGSYEVTAQAPGHVGAAVNVEIRDRFRAKVQLRLIKAKEELPPPESIEVRYDRDADLGEEIDERNVRKIEIEEAIRYGATDTEVPQSGEALLNKLANLMKKDPTLVRLIIVGHSHKLGDEGLEKRRSERRATYAKNFLVNAGIDQARLRVQARAAADPVAAGEDEEARAQNDRVNFVLWKSK